MDPVSPPFGALFDYQARIISLLGEISTAHVDIVVDHLLRLDAESSREITVFISCQGGHMADALKLVDCIGLLRSSLTAVCFGLVEGPAVWLLARAHRRILFPSALVSTAGLWDLPRLHPQAKPGIGLHPSSTAEDQLRRHGKERLRVALNDSAAPIEWLLDQESHPHFVNAPECLRLGLADAIVEGPRRLLQQMKRDRHENARLSH
jgi:ATP-dependent protease ClpP protease subunit